LSNPIVRVDNVSKNFKAVTALRDVSLEFQAGIIYGLLGPNGAGKTTLIRILTTLLRPDLGRAFVAGVDVVANPTEARQRLGLAGQSAAVDEYLTGRENVEMIGRLYNLSAREARSRTDEVLERISLVDSADRPVRTYSGGMRRRLDLAASIVGRPEVLFLDEPTTGVDPRSRIEIWELIEDLVASGTTVLLTTQYLDEADRLADRIAVIDHGLLVTEGTADELKDRVGGALVEIVMAPGDDKPVLQTLRDRGWDVSSRDGAIVVPAEKGSTTLIEVVRAIDSAGAAPIDIGLRRPTLDDVFLALTGHPADPSEAPGGEAT